VKKIHFIAVAAFLIIASLLSCNNQQPKVYKSKSTLAERRKQLKTKLVKFNQNKEKLETPPADLFSIVYFPTNIGNMAAYLGRIPDDGKLHPAMIWLTGGMGNGIDKVWKEADADNDQTASVFRKAGLVMMYPTQRGGNGSPGNEECFYGEIDDIIAARDFLAKQKGVDTNRIYLGGHSTGGTKALLVAETSDKFKAVFSFGPVSTVLLYGTDELTYDVNSELENILRAPGLWLNDIVTPTYVFEGNEGESNVDQLRFLHEMADRRRGAPIHFYEIKGKDHFSGLQPASIIIAKKIMADSLSFEDALFMEAGKKTLKELRKKED
jgi:alpha/beta superfamily hydrolase